MTSTTQVLKSPSKEPRTTSLQSDVIRVKATLTSKLPGFLMNPITRDLLEELAGVRSKAASDKDLPLKERALRKVIKEDEQANGLIGIPVTYLLSALIYAGRFVKSGKDKISTANSTTLYEFLDIQDSFFPFKNQEEPMEVDTRRGVSNNAGKTAAVAIVRPLYRHWEISVNFTIDTAVVSEAVVKKIFEVAGTKAGMGDFRPQKKGPFGRFSITEWQILDPAS